MSDTTSGPLAGITVVEFTNLIAGPYCGMLLADLGANVIKVEPLSGDLSRGLGPFVDGRSIYFPAMNRGKRSIAISPRAPETQPWIRALVDSADVVISNLRRGAMERGGLGYDDIAARNPGVVYTVISAFGADGPYADRAGIDLVFQGEAGMMLVNGSEGDPPVKTGTTVGDYLAATNAATATLAALVARATTGRGRRVDVSLRDGIIAIQSTWNALFFESGEQPGRVGTGSWFAAPNATYVTADGYVNMSIVSDRHFEIACTTLGLTELLDDPRFESNDSRVEHRRALDGAFSAVFSTAPTEHWVATLTEAGLPVGRVLELPQVFEDPQVTHHRMRWVTHHPTLGDIVTTGSPIRLEGSQSASPIPPPMLGEHTSEILAELGRRRGHHRRARGLRNRDGAMSRLTIVQLCGSLRSGSFNARFLAAVQPFYPEGTRFVRFDLGRLPLYNEDVRLAGPPEPVSELKDLVRASSGVTISTPEYNHSLPGVLKNGIDWLSRPPTDQPLRDKPVAFMTATQGPSGGVRCQGDMKRVLLSNGARLIAFREVAVPLSQTKMTDDGVVTDEFTIESLAGMVQAHVELIELLKRSDEPG